MIRIKIDTREARRNELKLRALRKVFAEDRRAELKAQREAQERRTARLMAGRTVSYTL